MREAGFTTFLVDDDPAVLKAITRLLNAAGYKTKSFSSPREFLSAHDPSIPGCAIIDLVMSELDGLHLQQALIERGSERPIIFLTGKGDVSTSVRAMKAMIRPNPGIFTGRYVSGQYATGMNGRTRLSTQVTKDHTR